MSSTRTTHRTTRRTRTALTAVAAATAATASLLGPLAGTAGAEVETVTDRRGDGSDGMGEDRARWGDLGKVRVNHRERSIVFTAMPAKGGRLADAYSFWVDTDPRDRGPEFVAGTNMELEPRAWVQEVESFGEFGEDTCATENARINRRTRVVTLRFPRTCFERPGSVRVAAQTQMDYEKADWAPNGRTFGPWVDRG